MISRFFIDRPIFAAVLSILITLAGAIAYPTLPLAMYPPITPPTVQVDCTFPGASAQVVSQSVATPIEQQVNGVEGMLYMSSQCTNEGTYNLTVAFENGVNLNLAQVLVQNRVNLALPQLPDVVKQTGVTTRKKSPDILMTINVFSPDDRYDQLYLSNYTMLRVRDEVARVPGIGDIYVLGQRDYSMRVWVDPERLAYLNLTAGDVVKVLRDQSQAVAAGSVGQEPVPTGQMYQFPLKTTGRLSDLDEFKNVVVKAMPEGQVVRLKDVASVKLSAKNEALSARVDKRPSVGLAIFQLPNANALATAELVLEKMQELKKDFPEGVDFQVSYDTTPYTRESINEVFKTLIEAIVLVTLVVLLFLQNWRSAIIPLVAVPVAIVGTFAVMAVLGFSLNNLTLFGLVLAIGIVVDDAIVVVEAVEHHIETGLPPRLATIKAMEQVSGPVIAVGLVLSAVFVPCAFISGITGQFFRQFALTIAVSTIISAFNSLTLSPALAAILLKPRMAGNGHSPASEDAVLPGGVFAVIGAGLGWYSLPRWVAMAWMGLHDEAPNDEIAHAIPWASACAAALLAWAFSRPMNWALARFFVGFNRAFQGFIGAYTGIIRYALRGSVIVVVLYVGLLGLTYWSFYQLPRGFIPSQDMGYLLVNVQLPDAASMERTKEVMNRVEEIAHDLKEKGKGISHTSAVSGQSFLLSATGSNFGSVFIMLDEFKNRQTPEKYSDAIIAELRERFRKEVPEAQIAVFGPPPIRGVGRAGGFKIMIEDRGDRQPRELQGYVDNLVELGNNLTIDEHGIPMPFRKRKPNEEGVGRKGLDGLSSVFRANVPALYVRPNLAQAMAMNVTPKDANDTMQIYLGSLYVNDFNLFGRTWQVVVQADAKYRDQVNDVRRLRVRSQSGEMVPLGSILGIDEINGPLILTRYNMYPAAAISGNAGPGVSSGEAIDYMQKIAEANLPANMSYEWTELAFLEVRSGNTAMIIFGFAVVMVFLVLAAQYESWSLPLAVILVVPMCILCAVAGAAVAKHDINIFTQVGFVVLVGLASKNAILIVEFAKHLRESGHERTQATLEACRLRLRPIIMTSLAFILGVVPLLITRGAGAEMRRTLGTAVFSGMLGVTLFGLLLTPVFFYLIDRAGSSAVFASPRVRMAGTILLHVMGFTVFSFYWIPLFAFRMVKRRRERPD